MYFYFFYTNSELKSFITDFEVLSPFRLALWKALDNIVWIS